MTLALRQFDDTDPLQLAWLRLSFMVLRPGRARQILKRWETPLDLLRAAKSGRDDQLLETPGLTPRTIELLRQNAERDLTPALEAIEKHGLWLLLDEHDDYPAALRVIPDPPLYLWMRGDIGRSDDMAVAIVGTRGPTEYGRGMATKFASDLARRGLTIVSGLARGIDTAAHKGALSAGGRTLACCGCGLDIAYPRENRALMDEISENGACISEFAPTVHPEPWHFPARNRIISGLSIGTLVVEAAARSGALGTADHSTEQGREVFAIPGNVLKAQSRGPHGLIKQGAALVENIEDVLEVLGARTLPFDRNEVPTALTDDENLPDNDSQREPKAGSQVLAASSEPEKLPAAKPKIDISERVRADLNETENRVYSQLELDGRHIDDIALAAGMSAGAVSATLLMLELKNLARRLPGGFFERLRC